MKTLTQTTKKIRYLNKTNILKQSVCVFNRNPPSTECVCSRVCVCGYTKTLTSSECNQRTTCASKREMMSCVCVCVCVCVCICLCVCIYISQDPHLFGVQSTQDLRVQKGDDVLREGMLEKRIQNKDILWAPRYSLHPNPKP
jgi:hypothetical protein